jgi:integrase
MGKRSNHEGSAPVQLQDGRWQARMTVDGRRKAFYGRTREEAYDKLVAAQADQRRGLPIVPEKLTVSKYLLGWLEASKLTARRYSTWKRKEELIRLHVLPTLGKTTLAKLTPQQVQTLYAQKKSEGLSLSTIHRLHNALHLALKQAVREGAVARNVTELFDAPSDEHRKLVVLHDAQIRTFIEVAMGDKWEAL